MQRRILPLRFPVQKNRGGRAEGGPPPRPEASRRGRPAMPPAPKKLILREALTPALKSQHKSNEKIIHRIDRIKTVGWTG